jgi:hypothetical protein
MLDITGALDASQALKTLAEANGDKPVALLALVVRLGILVRRGLWTDVPATLNATESALGLSYAVPELKGTAVARTSSAVSASTAANTTVMSEGMPGLPSVARTTSTASGSSASGAYLTPSSAGVHRTSSHTSTSVSDAQAGAETFIAFSVPFEGLAAMHVLLLGIVYYTHVGEAEGASVRLKHLHALLDSGAGAQFADGVAQVC